jgi:hypothetical protein
LLFNCYIGSGGDIDAYGNSAPSAWTKGCNVACIAIGINISPFAWFSNFFFLGQLRFLRKASFLKAQALSNLKNQIY